MISLFPAQNNTIQDRLQGRLLSLAALFIFLLNSELTIAPAVRLHSWNASYRWSHWIGYIVWLSLVVFAHRQTVRFLPDRDPYLLPIGALLSGLGLVTIWRLSSDLGFRQTAWLALIGLLLLAVLRLPDPLKYLRRYKYIWLISGLLLTAFTFIFGSFPGGSGPHLWLGCCGVYIQPSEPLKFLLIAYLAAYLADQFPSMLNLAGTFLPSLALTGIALVLLLAQRDLGTASLFIGIYASILFAVTGKRRILLACLIGLILAGIAGYKLFDVVQLRIDAWLNPWLDPTGRSYQIVQSLMAVANGGIIGRGIGLGSPGLVPIAHSDFVFSAILEENGLLGCIGLVLLLGLLVVRGFQTALRAPNNYTRYLTTGMTIYLTGQGILIMAGNLRLLPLTGVTLPFLSYGGSSLLTCSLALFTILIVSNRAEQEPTYIHSTGSYKILAASLLAGLFAIVLAAGWWSLWRGPDLLSRNDNPRRTVNDRFVKRGSILDQNSVVLVETTGQIGEYTRTIEYPALSAIIGYTQPVYGQASLEAALDPILRGIQGNSFFSVFWNQLVYGQPPPGLDVRLSLSLPLQKKTDELLSGHSGSAVLLNSKTGEILVMSSFPGFDANSLDQHWNELVSDPNYPLLNRATQGLYPPGTALAPFLLAVSDQTTTLPQPESLHAYAQNDISLQCSDSLSRPFSWGDLASKGCPNALISLSRNTSTETLINLYKKLGFYNNPDIILPTSPSSAVPTQTPDHDMLVLGQANLIISPLQMALAAAAFDNGGKVPIPQLLTGIKPGNGTWNQVPVVNVNSIPVFSSTQILLTTNALADTNLPIWSTTGMGQASAEKKVTWFIGSTLPDQQGASFTLVILLEEENPSLAASIGRALLQTVLIP